MKGLIQVYTGAGKGKTTAAFGLALRAAGQGLKVAVIQFMKGEPPQSGEVKSLEGFEAIDVHQCGGSFVYEPQRDADKVKKSVRGGLKLADKLASEGSYDVLILDEINVAVSLGLVEVNTVLDLMRNKPEGMELILTGRDAPHKVVEMADLVTEMVEIKHPYRQGVSARKGIEF